VTDEEIEAEIQTLAAALPARAIRLADQSRGSGPPGRSHGPHPGAKRRSIFLMAQATISEAYHLIKPA